MNAKHLELEIWWDQPIPIDASELSHTVAVMPLGGMIFGGLVKSINGQTGDVVLTADDVDADVAGSAQAVRDELKPQIEANTQELASKADATNTLLLLNQKINQSDIGLAGGVAELGADGKVPAGQLPAPTGGGDGLNETQVNTLIGKTIYFKNSIDNPPVNPQAWELSLAIGHGAQAGFDQYNEVDKENLAVGYNAWSRYQGVALGSGAKNNGGYDTAIGNKSQTFGDAVAVGFQANARIQSVAMGKGSVTNSYGTSLGYAAESGVYSLSAGISSRSTSMWCVTLGAQAQSGSQGSVAVGAKSRTEGMYGVAIGMESYAYGIAIGYKAKGAAVNQINIGVESGSLDYFAYRSVAIGSASKAQDDGVVIGATATGQAQGTISIGYGSLNRQVNGIVIGKNASAYVNGSAQASVVVGYNATTNYDNCVVIGNESAVTGANQVQLGNSATTTYTYGAVQNRSDARDKANIEACELGLDFINALQPKKWKWDYREDYLNDKFPMPNVPVRPQYSPIDLDPETTDPDAYKAAEDSRNATHLAALNTYDQAMLQWHSDVESVNAARCAWLANPTDKGSKVRNREHYGLIAQDVKAALDALGVDWGGYQDHEVQGGEPVQSIGYNELIAPLIKAVQQLSTRVQQLEQQQN